MGGGTKREMVDEHTEKGNGVMRDGGRNVPALVLRQIVKFNVYTIGLQGVLVEYEVR